MATLPTYQDVEAGGRPKGMPSGQVLGNPKIAPSNLRGYASSPEINRILNTNKSGSQLPMIPASTRLRQQADVPNGLSVPSDEEPISEQDKVKAKLREAAQQGGLAYVQAIAEVDPATATSQRDALIRQKSSIMKGKIDTMDMNDQEYGDYLKSTKKLSDLADDVQSVPMANRGVRYQQRLDKIRSIDPNAPESYDPNYVAIAAIEGKPIKAAMQDNAALKNLFNEPLNNREVEQVSPGASKLIGNADAKLVFTNDAGTYKVFESIDDKGAKKYTVDDNGTIRDMKGNVNVVPALAPEVISAAKQRREASANQSALSMRQQGMIQQYNKSTDPVEKDAIAQIMANDIKETTLARSEAIKQQNAIELEAFKAQVKGSQKDATELTKPTINLLQKKIIDNDSLIQKMDNLASNVSEDQIAGMLTLQGKVSYALAGVADYIDGVRNYAGLPGLGGKSPAELAAVKQQVMGPVFQVFQEFRLKFTGAQAALRELDQLEARILSGKMSPGTFKQAWSNIVSLAKDNNKQMKEQLKLGRIPDDFTDASQAEDDIDPSQYDDIPDDQL